MTRPLRIQYPGAFYHVFSRGNERRDIFRTDKDRDLFLAHLDECSRRFEVLIHAYCLMDNHIHLLIQTRHANLSAFSKRLLGVYTLRFNRIHKRAGHLFQGRYKAYLVEKDSYLLELSRYIHLNPVKAALTGLPEAYPWSSMRYFLEREAPAYLERSLILGSFASAWDYRAFVLEGLKGTVDPAREAIGGVILGTRRFAERFRQATESQEGIGGKRQLAERPLDVLLEITEFEEEDLQAYALWRFGRRTQKQIGGIFGKTDSAISHAIRRYSKRIHEDDKVRARVSHVEEAVSTFKN